MILQVGKAEPVKILPVIKKMNVFEHGSKGFLMEKSKGNLTLYVTNSACSKIFAVVPLGDAKALKENKFLVVAYSEDILLLHGKDIKVVADFAQKKVAVSKPGIPVRGKGEWGADPVMPWLRRFNTMFGIVPDPMDWDDGREFWKWFRYNELEILNRVSAGGEEARQVTAKVRRKLAPVLRFENPDELVIELYNNEEGCEFVVHHTGESQLKQDAELMDTLKPANLSAWKYTVME